jgi:hypothetical protein
MGREDKLLSGDESVQNCGLPSGATAIVEAGKKSKGWWMAQCAGKKESGEGEVGLKVGQLIMAWGKQYPSPPPRRF